jgi:hypothetical protein
MPYASQSEEVASCPSAQPDWKGSVAIGLVGGTANEPRMAHLSKPLIVNDQLLTLSGPVSPTEVFRFAAPWAEAVACIFGKAGVGLQRRS